VIIRILSHLAVWAALCAAALPSAAAEILPIPDLDATSNLTAKVTT